MQPFRSALIFMLAVACESGSALAPAPRKNAQPPATPRAEPLAEADPTDSEILELNSERGKHVAAGELDQADEVCAKWISRTNLVARAEGHKCSANVFVRRATDSGGGLMISDGVQRLAVGGMASAPRFSGEAIARAIDQLDQAATLRPSDISIHQGRMFLALGSGNYGRAVVSLDASLKQDASAPPPTWLEYSSSFPRTEASHAVEYMALLAQRFPEDAAVLRELGAWLAVAKKREEAKRALEKALQRDEQDAMTHWRLGEVLEASGDRATAQLHYKRSLALTGPLAQERQAAYRSFQRSRR